MARILARITGRVQGVGFRRWVQELAEAREIEGEVWNSPDGSVIVDAWHNSQDLLDEFVEQLAQGPGWAAGVEVSRPQDVRPGPGFSITRTR